MNKVKRYRASPRHTVETEFDDALLSRFEAVKVHVENICKAAGNQDSIATGYVRDVLDKINGEL